MHSKRCSGIEEPRAQACVNKGVIARRLTAPLLLCVLNAYPASTLTPEAARAFDRYAGSAEGSMTDLEHFLRIDVDPAAKKKLRGGEVRIDSCGPPDDLEVPGGMIQDWRGVMFIPRATIKNVKAILQEYGNYKVFYKPEVVESKELAHQGNDYDIFLRLRKRQILTVVLNTEYHVRYVEPDPHHMYVTSRSSRIAEVRDPDRSLADEEPVGRDSGFLWRLNSYWRFEEADGGVYAECRAISLSRDVPLGLAWMVKGFVTKFPKESMQNTLRGTKAAVQAQQ